jgi:glycosyltransferase involved in cell wall biosynthesis
MNPENTSENINVIFVGKVPYPHGMAGTRRIQHAIDSFKDESSVLSSVLVLRQSSQFNALSGVHGATYYETAVADVSGRSLLAALPRLYVRAMVLLRKRRKAGFKNVIYNYGPLNIENWLPLYYAKFLGYKIVFDIVEDYDVAQCTAQSLLQKMSIGFVNRISAGIRSLASGIIVISNHLSMKYHGFAKGKVPIYYRPISVDMERFPNESVQTSKSRSLFYAGSLGEKDGLPVLLNAFENLAAKRDDIRLVVCGQGDAKSTQLFRTRLDASPFKERIDYKGYLDDESYYSVLMSSDIPCMTRINLPYAHAGFPFKLGEFLASGKPVIASRVSDVDSFLVDRENAMMVRPGSSEDIVKAVEYLLDNPDAASCIGRNGRVVAGSVFDFRMQGRPLLSFLRGV